jgi:hypothetical protein
MPETIRAFKKHAKTITGGMAQVVECLLSKLSSIPSTTKKKKRQKLNNKGWGAKVITI